MCNFLGASACSRHCMPGGQIERDPDELTTTRGSGQRRHRGRIEVGSECCQPPGQEESCHCKRGVTGGLVKPLSGYDEALD
jgi:hypothetical protein